MRSFHALCVCLVLFVYGLVVSPAPAFAQATAPFSNATILVIRHGEKPDDGSDGLTPAGQARAQAYIKYFQTYKIDDKVIHISAIYAAADSEGDTRTRLTVEPLGKALGLPVNATFKNKHLDKLTRELSTSAVDKTVVICWHHHRIPDLLTALGADPNQLIPGGIWPDTEYGWVIQLCYDKDGHLIPAKTQRIEEGF